MIWPHSQDGKYNVKSGYQFLQGEGELVALTAPSNNDKLLWKGIWSLQVPNKIKNFVWQACHNALPTKASLFWSTIIDDPLCDRCHTAQETSLHALCCCQELDTVWSDQKLWFFLKNSPILGLQRVAVMDYYVEKKPRNFCCYSLVNLDAKKPGSTPTKCLFSTLDCSTLCKKVCIIFGFTNTTGCYPISS